jgi:hypothetical protein
MLWPELIDSREQEKLRTTAREIDEWFYSLNEWSQRTILSHMIGYLEASKDLISSGRQVRPDEILRAFSVMEDMINEAWKGCWRHLPKVPILARG